MTQSPGPNEEVSPDDALALIQSKELIAAIKPRLSTSPPSPLLIALVDLHNAGRVHLPDLINGPDFAEISGLRFYQVQAFFSQAIPLISGTVPDMVNFVVGLDPKADGSGSSRANRTAFRRWLDLDPTRAREVIALAEAGDLQAAGLLSIALQSLADLTETRRIAGAAGDPLRREALHALAWTPHPDEGALNATLKTVASLAPGANDVLKAQAVDAVVGAFSVAKASLTSEALDLIALLLEDGGDLTRHQAAQALWTDPPTLDGRLVGLLLGSLMSVKTAHAGTLETLDFGLRQLLDHDHEEAVVSFLFELMGSPDAEVPFSAFETTIHNLMNRPAVFDQALVRWLLADGRALGEGLADSLHHLDDANQRRTLAVETLGFSEPKLYALCVRAIGYLYLYPVLPASIVVSVLRQAAGTFAKGVEELLFDPLLVNYGGDLQTYLESVEKGDPAYASVRRVLNRKKAYIKGLQKAGSIKELRPPERHRQAEHDKRSDEMRRSFEVAQKASPLLSSVSRSIVLYGRQTTHVMIDQNGQRRLTESVMQSHSTVFEVPRSSILDPFGLEEMLLIFRTWTVPA